MSYSYLKQYACKTAMQIFHWNIENQSKFLFLHLFCSKVIAIQSIINPFMDSD